MQFCSQKLFKISLLLFIKFLLFNFDKLLVFNNESQLFSNKLFVSVVFCSLTLENNRF